MDISSPMPPLSTCFSVTGACSRLGVEAAARCTAISARVSSLKPYILTALPSGVGVPVSIRWYALLGCGPAGLATQLKRPKAPVCDAQMAPHTDASISLRASSLDGSLPSLSNTPAARAPPTFPAISGAIHRLLISPCR